MKIIITSIDKGVIRGNCEGMFFAITMPTVVDEFMTQLKDQLKLEINSRKK